MSIVIPGLYSPPVRRRTPEAEADAGTSADPHGRGEGPAGVPSHPVHDLYDALEAGDEGAVAEPSDEMGTASSEVADPEPGWIAETAPVLAGMPAEAPGAEASIFAVAEALAHAVAAAQAASEGHPGAAASPPVAEPIVFAPPALAATPQASVPVDEEPGTGSLEGASGDPQDASTFPLLADPLSCPANRPEALPPSDLSAPGLPWALAAPMGATAMFPAVDTSAAATAAPAVPAALAGAEPEPYETAASVSMAVPAADAAPPLPVPASPAPAEAGTARPAAVRSAIPLPPAGDGTAEEAVMEVRGASKIYLAGPNAVAALTDMSLKLNAGELTGIVGPSGSGKTTFLMIAGLLEPPSTGAVYFRGRPIADPQTKLNSLRDFRRTHVGFIFQKANLIPFLTAVENVQIALEINDVRPRAARARARELLAQFGLDHREDNYPTQLSGGEQQRVSIARALANDPVLLLADEPTAALDGKRGRQVMEAFRSLADERRVAVGVVTHDPRWSDIFDRIVEMSDGRMTSERPGGAEAVGHH